MWTIRVHKVISSIILLSGYINLGYNSHCPVSLKIPSNARNSLCQDWLDSDEVFIRQTFFILNAHTYTFIIFLRRRWNVLKIYSTSIWRQTNMSVNPFNPSKLPDPVAVNRHFYAHTHIGKKDTRLIRNSHLAEWPTGSFISLFEDSRVSIGILYPCTKKSGSEFPGKEKLRA